MAKPKVIMTRRWPEAVEAAMAERFDMAVNRSSQPPSETELKEALVNADALVTTGTDPLRSPVFETPATRTKLIASCGPDIRHIDVDAATDRGITVTSSPDLLSEQIADKTLLLMLTLASEQSGASRRSGTSSQSGEGAAQTGSLHGKTLGLIGFGQVGQAVAKRAAHGFGMRVLTHHLTPINPNVVSALGATEVTSIDALLPEADFVSLHCSGGADNYHLIDARRLDLMKPEAFLINTAHGEVVDERALVQALWFETIGGAGIGVAMNELQRLPQLRACENATILPHPGDAILRTREAAGFRMIDNVVDFFEGRSPRDRV